MDLFREHIIRLLPRLRRFAISLCGNLPDADDLLQTTIEKALKRQGGYRAEYKLESWLFKIMQNQWIDQKRKEKRHGTPVALEEQRQLVSGDGVTLQETRSTMRTMLSAINALPEQQQLIVARVLVDGQSYEETAKELGIPVGTVMSRLYRARKTLPR